MAERWTMQFGSPVTPARHNGVLPSTKFGGQPDWLAAPAWPIGRTLGEMMRFVAQIELPPPLRVGGHRMAYVFLADHDHGHDTTPWDADAGDNAVILQGGGRFSPAVETRPTPTGPTLRGARPGDEYPFADDSSQPEVEIPVRLGLATEPDPLSAYDEMDLRVEDPKALDAHKMALQGSKVGGHPRWIHGPETPAGGPWQLLAQIDAERVPCPVPFDDVLYAFVAPDGRAARMLCQVT